jgi:hypothetical protein
VPDNVTLPPSATKAATREVSYSGELAHAQAVALVTLDGADDAKTAADVSQSNGLPVTVYGEAVEALEAMRLAVQALTRTMGQMQPDTAARMRVALDSISAGLTLATITTVSTVTTVATLTNQVQIGGLAATEQIPSLMRLGADSARRNITVT